MSRAASGDVIFVSPKSNVYTVLTIVAALVEVIGLVVLFMQASKLLPPPGLM